MTPEICRLCFGVLINKRSVSPSLTVLTSICQSRFFHPAPAHRFPCPLPGLPPPCPLPGLPPCPLPGLPPGLPPSPLPGLPPGPLPALPPRCFCCPMFWCWEDLHTRSFHANAIEFSTTAHRFCKTPDTHMWLWLPVFPNKDL